MYFARLSKSIFKAIVPDQSLNCRIECRDTKIRISFSYYDLETGFGKNKRSRSSFVHRMVNGIRFPIYFPKMHGRSKEIYTYIRIFCNERKKNSYLKYNHDERIYSEKIDYWSENFVVKLLINCSASALSIHDCKAKNLSDNYHEKIAYRIKCVYEEIPENRDKSLLIKQSNHFTPFSPKSN